MSKIDIRIEKDLDTEIKNLSKKYEISISDVIRYLAWISIGIQKEGGIQITGPLGIIRPLARVDLGEDQTRISVLIEDKLEISLKKYYYPDNIRDSLRDALRDGIVALRPDRKIMGPLGLGRPLSSISVPEIKDERSLRYFQFLGGKAPQEKMNKSSKNIQ